MIAIIVFERWRVEVEAYWHKNELAVMTAFLHLDLKSVCSSAEGELEPKLCFCQSEILE